MKVNGEFRYQIGPTELLIKWQGEGKWWPDEESGPGFWDMDLSEISCELPEFCPPYTKYVSRFEMSDDIWELIVDRATKELHEAHGQKIEEFHPARACPGIVWPDEVNF